MPDDHPFAVCLTHDVDRPYKRAHQALYYAVRECSPAHFRSLLPARNPYWQYEDIMALEDRLGVRSAFYFLNEPPLFERPAREWVRPETWVQQLGRYDVTAFEVVDLIRTLDSGGWEVGLHGSYHSPEDRERLRHEKTTLEGVLGHDVVGGRQHYLRLSVPETWEHHRAIGLRYDATPGSSTDYGFEYGYRPFAPFEDFLVFPLTLMEQALERHASLADRWAACERLLEEARRERAVVTVLWHPRYFNESEFPGFRHLYRRLVERALELGAWVGPPAEFRTESGRDGTWVERSRTATHRRV
jgi:peptidoglycan/xylan/chitin deacetylase (PgdA/CDA1 family)